MGHQARGVIWPPDAVVLESTTNAWHLVDQLQPLVASVTVAHPPRSGSSALLSLIAEVEMELSRLSTSEVWAKQGRREMRAALVEAAWIAVERNHHWKETFRRLGERIGE